MSSGLSFLLHCLTILTFSDDSFEAYDVGVIKLAHYAGLAQEVASLLLCVSCFKGLDGHTDLSFPRHLQTSTTHFTKLTCKT